MPDTWTQILYAIGVLTALVTALWAVFKGSKDSKATIDKRIDERMEKEIKRLDEELESCRGDLASANAEIASLKSRESTAVAEAHAVKRVVQRWVRVLKAWDRDGRMGPLPLPSDEDLHRLEISPATPPAGLNIPKIAN